MSLMIGQLINYLKILPIQSISTLQAHHRGTQLVQVWLGYPWVNRTHF